MSDNPAARMVELPRVGAPRPFVDRRVNYRRAADQLAHRETVFLARSLDVLAADSDAETRLGGLLALLASTVGARRAAVLADGHGRRVAVSQVPGEDSDEAEALASWLDAWAPRTRASRAASGRAPVAIVLTPVPEGRPLVAPLSRPNAAHHYACLPIPSAGSVALGFDFATEQGPIQLEERLPQQLARHAAVALALVTDQIATERELAGLRGRDTERSRFVSTVAHELRTPLTGLSGYLELILGGQVTDESDQLDFLQRSRQIVDTMTQLVGDLLELSRLESGTLRLEIGAFSLAEIGQRVVDGLTPIAMSRGVELRTSLPPRLKAATGDRRRVEQILTNLIGNALKFAPVGSSVELAAWFDSSVAVVAVRDEGVGIPPDDRARIFERFYRIAGHERITGTGLGLPIARDMARAMAGDLDVASVPGSGSSFVLVLPGPVGAEPTAVASATSRAVAEEEVGLEERAVLRAIASAPATERRQGDRRQGETARPTLLRGAMAATDDRQPPPAKGHLRSIDGSGGRSHRSPA
ncbi:MAG: HAMP domain-containing histidine kinase [Chloroflexi bacterium]|nr:MAG: HAMP domain-containing histidine kinase [Chloroflexota bacterium]